MTKRNKINLYCIMILIILIGIAVTIRLSPFSGENYPEYWVLLGLIRSGIYIGIFIVWGFTLYWRVIQKKVSYYLISMDFLMFFLLTVRTIKFFFIQDINWIRYFWYLYYLPSIFIPLLIFLVSVLIAHPKKFEKKKWIIGLFILSGFFFFLVLTNDFHQMVFSFPSIPYTDSDNQYEVGFYFVTIWEYLLGGASLVILFRNSRLPQSRKRVWTPLIPIGILLLYQILYVLHVDWLREIAGDITVVQCLLIALSIEICIQCGFIQTNMRYEEFFRSIAIPTVIVNQDYQEYISSKYYTTLSAEKMKDAQKSSIVLKDGMRLSSAEIKGGYVFWEEDVYELMNVLYELKHTQENLQNETELLKENYEIEKHIRQLEEQNFLYDEIHKKIAGKVRKLGNLLEQFQNTEDEIEKKSILQKMMVIGVYIKRSSNLVFIAQQNEYLSQEEIILGFEETIDNLRLSDIESACYIHLEQPVHYKVVQKIYEFYEEIIEKIYEKLEEVFVRIYQKNHNIIIHLNIMSNEDLRYLNKEQIGIKVDDDGIYDFELQIAIEGRIE